MTVYFFKKQASYNSKQIENNESTKQLLVTVMVVLSKVPEKYDRVVA